MPQRNAKGQFVKSGGSSKSSNVTCYTRKKKDGGKYTTCKDKTGAQLRGGAKPKEPAPKKKKGHKVHKLDKILYNFLGFK